jgi:hypothetical protein
MSALEDPQPEAASPLSDANATLQYSIGNDRSWRILPIQPPSSNFRSGGIFHFTVLSASWLV